METVFETIDKTGRKIRLTNRQWSHITITHAEMTNYLEEIENTLTKPIKFISQERGNLKKYYSYHKHRKHSEKYLRVITKYLNGEGFVITAHFVRNIQ